MSRALQGQKERGRLGLIAEIKRRRFGGSDLFRGRSAAEIAFVYHSAGATALSVVTHALFGGSMRLLAEVSAAGLGLPILRKDLIRTERDVQASKRAGASAVLLVAGLLEIERLAGLLQVARGEGVEPFVEVASRQEMDEVRERYDGLVAINNSDVKTNETEGQGISRSLDLIDRRDTRVWVSASRIGGPNDVRALAAAGFDGILIGTYLLLADDLRVATERIVAATSVGIG